jgi:filamentous hemagglutinin family protein
VGWGMVSAIAVFLPTVLFSGAGVFAQTVPDGTLGTEGSRVVPMDALRDRIDGGALRGVNLFHSFTEFNVGDGRGVYFANPAGIETIFSRVTGGNVSNILGTLGVLGNANLFFLNPNGIVFGPNARLDVRGSFVGSTGSGFKFGDGNEFSATNPQAAPLLTVNVPLGLQYGKPKGNVKNEGALAVDPGKTLTLHGNTVTSTGSLSTPGGTVQVLGDRVSLLDNARIDVSSATGGGTVLIGGDLQGKGTAPTATQTFGALGAIIQADAIDSGNGGKVVVWADGTTRFYGTISARGGQNSGNGGFVEVSGKQTLDFNGRVEGGAANGLPGTLLLDPTNIEIVLMDGNGDNLINANTISQATMDVILNADNNITFSAPINIAQPGIKLKANAGNKIDVNETVKTNGGDITLNSIKGDINVKNDIDASTVSGWATIRLKSEQGSVFITDANLKTSHFGGQTSGDIIINAAQNIIIQSTGSGLDKKSSSLESRGSLGRIYLGTDPDINAQTTLPKQIRISNSALVTTNDKSGTGGEIYIKAEQIKTNNAFLTARSSGSANGGIITLEATGADGTNTTAIEINSSTIEANISGSGKENFEGIKITASNGTVALIENSQISTSRIDTEPPQDKPPLSASPIQITAKSVSLKTSSLNSTTSTNAKGGDITLKADDKVSLEANSLINTAVLTGGTQEGGKITITTRDFDLAGGSRVQTRTYGDGKAGDVQLDFTGAATISGNNAFGLYSGMLTSSDKKKEGANLGSGSGGKIMVNSEGRRVGTLTLSDGGFLSAKTVSSNPGGDIKVYVDTLNLDKGGQIITNTQGDGKAGSITIDTTNQVTISGSRLVSDPLNPVDLSSFSQLTIKSLSGSELNFQKLENVGLNPTITQYYAGSKSSQDDKFDYYSFTISEGGSRGVFDIDNENTGNDIYIFLVNQDTGQLLARNDDAPTQLGGTGDPAGSPGSTGSKSIRDSYLSYYFPEPGNYILGIGKYSSTSYTGDSPTDPPVKGFYITKLSNTDSYTLQVSLQNQVPSSTPLPDPNPNPEETASGIFARSGNRMAPSNDTQGIGGNISVSTGILAIKEQGLISATTYTAGKSGKIDIKATNEVNLSGNGTGISAQVGYVGIQGSADTLSIQTQTLNVIDNARISASTFGAGNAGELLKIDATNAVNLNSGGQIIAQAFEDSTGKGGKNLEITTRTLTIQGGAKVSAETRGTGQGGNVSITSTDSVLVSGEGSSLLVKAGVPNKGAEIEKAIAGNLTINTKNLTVADSGTISASNLAAKPEQSGSSGNIFLNGLETLQVLSNGSITASTESGQAGRLVLNDPNQGYRPASSVNLVNGKLALSATNNNSEAGDILLNTRQLTLQQSSEISAAALGTATAGELKVYSNGSAADAVSLSGGSSIKLSSESGTAGDILIKTRQLTLDGNSQISAANISAQPKEGQSFGNITLDGLDSLQVTDSLISASTKTGTAGNLTVTADNVELRGQFIDPLGQNRLDPEGYNFINPAGLTVEATDFGKAGKLMINTHRLEVLNGAAVNVSSGGEAGELIITANRIDLDRGKLAANTGATSGNGANISIQGVTFLFMKNESLISASAANAATGGDVSINADFIIGLRPTGRQGSDIRANANQGNAGTVTIRGTTATKNFGVFGFRVGRKPTRYNDITASSQSGASGIVDVDTLNLDPTQGIEDLLLNLIDPSRQIKSACSATPKGKAGRFVAIGRGGFPPDPSQLLSLDALLTADGQPVDQTMPPTATLPNSPSLPPPTATEIIEATGWVVTPDGKVFLIADAPAPSSYQSPLQPVSCDDLVSPSP